MNGKEQLCTTFLEEPLVKFFCQLVVVFFGKFFFSLFLGCGWCLNLFGCCNPLVN